MQNSVSAGAVIHGAAFEDCACKDLEVQDSAPTENNNPGIPEEADTDLKTEDLEIQNSTSSAGVKSSDAVLVHL